MEKVAVLMSSFNGEKFIEQQIESILSQREVEVFLYVRDDGSTDSTRSILEMYQNEGKLKWYTGENLKPAKSFMNLINNVPDDYEYYALSDQDDYWLDNKLSVAVDVLKSFSKDIPGLYYGNTILVDKDLRSLNQRAVSYVSDTMRQSIISSGCTGCTICFNKKLLDYLRKKDYTFGLMHDNWIHKVCTSLDGNLYYDNNPYMLYRQHGNNVIGGQSTKWKSFKRHCKTITENRCYRSKSIEALYLAYKDYMPEHNKSVCEEIIHYHKGFNRFKIVLDKRYRLGDKRLDTLFIGAVLLGVF